MNTSAHNPTVQPRKLADFGRLSRAEQMLRDGIGTGEFVIVGDGRPDSDAGEGVQVRGTFLRYLVLGGCAALPAPVHEKGVQLAGARITEALDLEGCESNSEIALFACHFDERPIFLSARLRGVMVDGSRLPGLMGNRLASSGTLSLKGCEVSDTLFVGAATLGGDLDSCRAELIAGQTGNALFADRLEAKGSVFLRDVTATGAVRLLGAKLGGELSCNGASLTAGKDGYALSADNLEANGSVFLRDVTATGEVRLPGAKLGGNLDCIGSRLTAGDDGYALNCDNIQIGGTLVLRLTSATGGVSLGAATVGALCDDAEFWQGSDLYLDRFTYGAFVGDGAPTTPPRASLG